MLKKHTRGLKRNLDELHGGLLPAHDLFYILLGNLELVTITHRRLKKNTDGVLQLIYSLISEGGYAVVAAAAFEVQGETSQGEAKRIAAIAEPVEEEGGNAARAVAFWAWR